jgi:hypothetical protein
MHEAALSFAALPAPVRIFGLPMRPYSLGHEMFLIREQNPILSGDSATVSREKLAQAVLICSSSFQECRRFHSDYLASLKLAIFRRKTRKIDHGPEIEAFFEYRKDGTKSLPGGRQTVKDADGRIAGAPFLLRLYQFLVVDLNTDPDAAWDYPLGLAMFQFATYWEERGTYSVFSELDQLQNEALAALDAEEALVGAKGNN